MIHLSTDEDGDLGGTDISNEKDRTKLLSFPANGN